MSDVSLPTGEIISGYSRDNRIQLCKNIECTYLVHVEQNRIDLDLGFSRCQSCGHNATWEMEKLQRLRPSHIVARMTK